MNTSQRHDGSAGEVPPAAPVIGFLTESLTSLYQSNLWIGASDAAMRSGYSLFCFAGGSLSRSSWDEFEPQRNIIYNFIDTGALKGIIIAGSLGNFITGDEFRSFYNRFTDIPLVCLGPEIPTVPTVIADNSHGMRELISHLVETHGCRRIAFVRGPEANQEAEERLRIFREVLIEHDLPPDAKLILSGDFSRDAGSNAVEYLLGNGYEFDALVGANDDTALGALKAFQEHHVRVPEEVLVVGFDDIEESRFSAPPLTTVRQPLYEMGSKAVEVIHNCITGQDIKGTIIVPATLMTRHSCGCFRHRDVDERLFRTRDGAAQHDRRVKLRIAVEKIITGLLHHQTDTFDRTLVAQLTDAFDGEITGVQPGKFISLVNRISWNLAISGGDVMGLYHVLTVLRQYAVVYSGDRAAAMEGIFQNANIAVADSATRAQANRRLAGERRATVLRSAGQAIASSIDLSQLVEIIAMELVNLEVDGCYLSLYENPERTSDRITLHLMLALYEGKRLSIDPENSAFSAPDLLPRGIPRINDPCSLLIEPLFFREGQIGMVVFRVRRCRDGLTYEILQQHISSALKGTLLMKKVQDQSAALEIANMQLRKLRDTEHAYLEAIKHELELGREIQMSFLPNSIPEICGWEIVTAFQPAREVSGDFYDIFTLPDGKVVMVICDVSGKDVSAALFMALIRTLIRALAEQALSGASEPLDAVGLANRYLINHHYGHNDRYMYATLFMAVLDTADNSVQYINSGHNPGALITADSTISQWVGTTGPAIGIMPDARFGKKKLIIGPQETLFLYTDGVTEARSTDGSMFSKQRLSELLRSPVQSAVDLVGMIDRAVKEHRAGIAPFDDITMIALRRTTS